MPQYTGYPNKLTETFVSPKYFAHSSSIGQTLLLSGYKGFAHCKNLNELMYDGELRQHSAGS